MLNNLFGGDDNNILLIILLVFLLLGNDKDHDCDHDHRRGGLGGIFEGDSLIWILIIFFLLGDVF